MRRSLIPREFVRICIDHYYYHHQLNTYSRRLHQDNHHLHHWPSTYRHNFHSHNQNDPDQANRFHQLWIRNMKIIYSIKNKIVALDNTRPNAHGHLWQSMGSFIHGQYLDFIRISVKSHWFTTGLPLIYHWFTMRVDLNQLYQHSMAIVWITFLVDCHGNHKVNGDNSTCDDVL